LFVCSFFKSEALEVRTQLLSTFEIQPHSTCLFCCHSWQS